MKVESETIRGKVFIESRTGQRDDLGNIIRVSWPNESNPHKADENTIWLLQCWVCGFQWLKDDTRGFHPISKPAPPNITLLKEGDTKPRKNDTSNKRSN
jgi:hypothetical protein